jgi:hypothetical protein
VVAAAVTGLRPVLDTGAVAGQLVLVAGITAGRPRSSGAGPQAAVALAAWTLLVASVTGAIPPTPGLAADHHAGHRPITGQPPTGLGVQRPRPPQLSTQGALAAQQAVQLHHHRQLGPHGAAGRMPTQAQSAPQPGRGRADLGAVVGPAAPWASTAASSRSRSPSSRSARPCSSRTRWARTWSGSWSRSWVASCCRPVATVASPSGLWDRAEPNVCSVPWREPNQPHRRTQLPNPKSVDRIFRSSGESDPCGHLVTKPMDIRHSTWRTPPALWTDRRNGQVLMGGGSASLESGRLQMRGPPPR